MSPSRRRPCRFFIAAVPLADRRPFTLSAIDTFLRGKWPRGAKPVTGGPDLFVPAGFLLAF